MANGVAFPQVPPNPPPKSFPIDSTPLLINKRLIMAVMGLHSATLQISTKKVIPYLACHNCGYVAVSYYSDEKGTFIKAINLTEESVDLHIDYIILSK